MLQETAARVSSAEFASPLIVAGEHHGPLVDQQLSEVGIRPAAILLEPEARNTAAVAALACEWALARDRDEILLLMPSDHVILDTASFLEGLQTGLPHASEGGIVTFGVHPSEPNTQYGYIEAEPSVTSDGVCRIVRFVEKPQPETAEKFCDSGRHYWNSGIFMFRPGTMVEELEQHLPDTRRSIALAFERRVEDGLFIRPERSSFGTAESISLDYAVMQKTDRGFVVPVTMGWSDVGSWSSVWLSSPKDKDNNAVAGDVLVFETKNSLVRSYGSATIVTIGLEDLVVVSTRDAVLVAPLSRSNEVKNIVEQLAAAGRSCATALPDGAREEDFSEIPFAPYRKEDDIVRLEDEYDRA